MFFLFFSLKAESKVTVKGIILDFEARFIVILLKNLYSSSVSIGKLCMSGSRYAVQSQVY